MKNLRLRLLFLTTATLATFGINNVHAQDLKSATFLTRSEQYDKAQTMFEQLIQKEPKNSKNYFFCGENYLLDYFADTISNSLSVASKAAKDLYEKGVTFDPNDPLNYIGLAKVAFYLGDNKTAIEMRTKAKSFLLPYKKIKKIKPPAQDYAFALAKIAESYIKDDKVDTSLALPLIREAIKIDSKNRDIYFIAGDIYLLVKDGSNAVKSYNSAQYCDPQSPTAKMKIGNIYVRARSFMAAIPYFEEAIQINASYAPAYRELGQLYALAGRFEQSKENFKKYLELTQGNIPAKIRYVTSLFYAKGYEDVIKNVDEIIAIDKSRAYMNRIAGYSCYEKTPPDYDKALVYLDALFKNVSPEMIIKRDYQYLSRILLKKNQNYTDIVGEYNKFKTQLESDNKIYQEATVAVKAKLKQSIDTLTLKIENLDKQISKANQEIDRAFVEYAKLLSFDPQDKSLLNEIAVNYYRFNRYEEAAKTWSKMIGLGKDDVLDYMQAGKAYYNAEKYKSADSVFSMIINKYPDYLDAYIYDARTYSRMDKELKSGQAHFKFELVLGKAKVDSVKNANYIIEACDYLGYYHLRNENFNKSKDYYSRMINLDANSKENKVKGYIGLGAIELMVAGFEKAIEGKLSSLKRAADNYKQILTIEPNNEGAKNLLKYVQDYQIQIKKGINPNEIKGIVKNSAGQPIKNASVRVKDTAAESLTNIRGEFVFEIPMGSEALIISANGYKSKEIPIQRPLKPLRIALEQ